VSVNATDHPVLDVIRDRWSPYRFEPRVLGYPDTSDPVGDLAGEVHRRETAPRQILSLGEQVFSEKWGAQANFLS
jgi:hypothetical protein